MSSKAKINVIPALQYRDAKAAIEFLCRAFGFEKKAVYEDKDGSVAHAELTHGNGMIMLGSAKDSEYGKLLKRPSHYECLHRRRGRRCSLCPCQGRRRCDHPRAGDAGLWRP